MSLLSSSLAERVESLTGLKLSDFQRKAIDLIDKGDRNIIVSAPTGSGKSIIGYAALLKHKGFYLAPLIALMNEKYRELSSLLKKVGYSVIISNRDYRIPAQVIMNADVKIMSPYKFLTYAHMIKRSSGAVVVDEIHKMSRDPLFEAAVTVARRKGLRVVGLSATISDEDLQKLASWLDAEVVKETNRPVELRHIPVFFDYTGSGYMIKAENEIVENGKPIVERGETFIGRYEAAAEIAARLFFHTGKSVIVWVPTRRLVRQTAIMISDMLPERSEFAQLADKVVVSSADDRILKTTLRKGVWVHYGALSYSTREFVETNYRKAGGVIVTAYTLSHGVNIPGTYLVFSTLFDYKGDVIDPSTFHQISGRAGRPLYDTLGVVLTLIVGKSEAAFYNHLINTKAAKIYGSLLSDTYSAAKISLPIYARAKAKQEPLETVIQRIENLLKDSYDFYTTHDEEKLAEAMSGLSEIIEIYEKEIGWSRESEVACLMGMHPIELLAVRQAISVQDYSEAINKILGFACELEKIDPAECEENLEVSRDIKKYGYLAAWLGSTPVSRTLAERIQTVLETGAFWAARTYGWKSEQHEKMLSLAKKFSYAGNEYVEPLAKALTIDQLRRVVKAVPAIIQSDGGSEPISMVAQALKEIFLFRKVIKKAKMIEMAKLAFYAIEKRQPNDLELDIIIRRSIEVIKEANKEVRFT